MICYSSREIDLFGFLTHVTDDEAQISVVSKDRSQVLDSVGDKGEILFERTACEQTAVYLSMIRIEEPVAHPVELRVLDDLQVGRRPEDQLRRSSVLRVSDRSRHVLQPGGPASELYARQRERGDPSPQRCENIQVRRL
jgi:hypothetical protein